MKLAFRVNFAIWKNIFYSKIFQDFYSSFQFALSLLNAKRYREALCILDECIDIREDPVALILAADISIRFLHKPKQALRYLSYPAAKEVY